MCHLLEYHLDQSTLQHSLPATHLTKVVENKKVKVKLLLLLLPFADIVENVSVVCCCWLILLIQVNVISRSPVPITEFKER